jgi:hypothetical protein
MTLEALGFLDLEEQFAAPRGVSRSAQSRLHELLPLRVRAFAAKAQTEIGRMGGSQFDQEMIDATAKRDVKTVCLSGA